MLSGILTVLALLAFVGGAAYVYSAKRKPEFDEASRIPLDEDQSENTP
ncbi:MULTISPECIES: cbb3-type cytochrome oxidase subunit 3 [Arenimonas]|nr:MULTISPECIES: CcoQ/FixQ family Cbb3-type cytochrome c oxidase assembly chaperone [Arenimonas]HEX4854882.1 CcoQ/FixQ family Cbb3-type cytochrome c oxidase assembly chaperone [Arenimonas sp.]